MLTLKGEKKQWWLILCNSLAIYSGYGYLSAKSRALSFNGGSCSSVCRPCRQQSTMFLSQQHIEAHYQHLNTSPVFVCL